MALRSAESPRRSLTRWCWLGYWVLLLLATHWPVTAARAPRFPHADKLVHFALYFVLTLLGWRYVRAALPRGPAFAMCCWVVVYSAAAAVDEWSQRFITGRTPDLKDWLADVSGVILATLIARLFDRRKPPVAIAVNNSG